MTAARTAKTTRTANDSTTTSADDPAGTEEAVRAAAAGRAEEATRPEEAEGPPSRRYHHGDLRRAILSAALDVIGTDGPSTLSLRDLARRAGVSHAAPAHHFKDRTGLLTAIAAEGYALLAAALGDADGLRDAGVRYVRFATGHPAHFQVMFTPELLRGNDVELTAARALAGERLRTAVADSESAGRTADARLAGVAAWSLAHGFATLLLGHNLDAPIGDRDPEDVFRTLSGMLFRSG
ncbi:TetR/AcrR family transcriptional regulator [Streptomyces sp. NPDC093228]|uniref:TetR/AcrR family transcriptional regulator n=1 Tax=unclassified Streptomyces TaxID=2593676 RepID=UPI00099EE010|nr:MULTISPECIES: TetR/AcrR family transcriptional regulator [unclassified Streptomyces]MDX3262759.1 TetR/AcrR family transcriptional regulator [Streptomyces sp. MI02-2A]REE61261.1 TetR family transcriptional regulator [Streptomyces sp. 3212.3]